IWRSPWNLKRQPSPCSSACNTRWRAPSCPHVACASTAVRSSRSTTSINRRSAMCRHLSHLSLMISFLILSTCLILLLLREVRGSLSEMYCPLRLPVRDHQGLLLWQQPPFPLIDSGCRTLVDRCQFRGFFRLPTECARLNAVALGEGRQPDRPWWIAALRIRRQRVATACGAQRQALEELRQVFPTGSCCEGSHEPLKLLARLLLLLELTFEQTHLPLQLRAPALEGCVLLSDLLTQHRQLSQDIAHYLFLRAELLPDLLQGVNGPTTAFPVEGINAGDRHFPQAVAVVDRLQLPLLNQSVSLAQ